MAVKKTKKEIEKELELVYMELNHKQRVIDDLISSIYHTLFNKSKYNFFTKKNIISTDIIIEELGRIKLSDEIKHPRLRKIYLNS